MNTGIRNKLLIVVMSILIGLVPAPVIGAGDIKLEIVWLPEQAPQSPEDDSFNHLAKFLLTEAPQGIRIQITDGITGNVVTQIDVPQLRYDNVAVRRERMMPQLGKLKQWRDQARVRSGVRLPEVLDAIAGNLDADCNVVIWGDPLYKHVRSELSFSHAVPSTAVFAHKATEHPWGLVGSRDVQGAAFLWIVPEGTFADGRNQRAVEQFIGAYLDGRGASGLFAFKTDAVSVLKQSLTPQKQEDRITAPPADVQHQEAFRLNRDDVSQIRRDFQDATQDFPAAIGIAWPASGVDLDLWAFTPDGDAASYRHKQAGGARHLVDILNGTGMWECIVLTEIPTGYEFWINCFSRQTIGSHPIQGVYFYRQGDRIIEGSFTLPAGADGDGAVNPGQRRGSPNWIKIEVPVGTRAVVDHTLGILNAPPEFMAH